MNSAAIPNPVPSRFRGFTLLELMVTVAIVGILVAIAIPAYTDQVRKARRGQAKADLVEYAQMLERHHTVNNSYVGFSLPTLQSPREAGSTARYTLAINPQTANGFVITATAVNDQVNDRCGHLSLSNTGVKTRSNTSVPLSDCW